MHLGQPPVVFFTEKSTTMALPVNQLLEAIKRLDPTTPEFEPLDQNPWIYVHAADPYQEIAIGPVEGLKLGCLQIIVGWVEAIIEVYAPSSSVDCH